MNLEKKWCFSCKKRYDLTEHFTNVEGVYKCNFVIERQLNKIKTKKCYKCNKTMPITHFIEYIDKKGKIKLGCHLRFDENNQLLKVPSMLKGREYPHRKKSKYKKNTKEWNKDLILRNRYGINLEEYQELINLQDNSCAICFTSFENMSSNKIHVDHCHKNNKVRGILCSKCNKGLGLFKDNTQTIEKAIKYLKKHNEKETVLFVS